MVLPSKYEAFANVIVEGMSRGLTCICLKNNDQISVGNNDIIEDGKTGILLKKDTPKALADVLDYLINKPELIEKIGKNARQYIKSELTINRVALKYLSLFPDMLNNIHN